MTPFPLLLVADFLEFLPEGFLRDNRWALFYGLVGLIGLVVVLTLMKGMFSRKRPLVDSEAGLNEDLTRYPPAPGLPGPRRLTVHGEPVRVRLIVLAAPGHETVIDPRGVAKYLDGVLPGLGPVAALDQPRVKLWPAQLSNLGFINIFHRRVYTAAREGQPSRWVLLAGKAMIGKSPILVGLALEADDDSMIGRLRMEPQNWREYLRIES